MRYLQTLLLAMLLPLCASARGWNETEYKQIEQSIERPVIANRTILITAYGAKTSASAAQNQKAINRAIAVASMKGGRKPA